MSAIVFQTFPCGRSSSYLRHSSAVLDAQHHMTIGATREGSAVQMDLNGSMLQSYMLFTAEQARAVAAELVACADALQGRG
jgi:hypothetical protein